MPELGIGSVLGGYRIDGVVGQGGMGVVYRATQLRLQRTVALKVIMPALANDPGFRERFERESRLAASIDHNHVVPVHEANEVDGLLYIAMRYVDGKDLRTLVESEGPLAPERAARIIAQVASALDAAHAHGLVHRDVKPGNILVTGRGAEEHVFLTDFGLTKSATEAGLTKTGQWVGTLDYAAPEQINNGPVDARTDVYALGCVLYHALTGHVPYVRDSDVAKMYAHLHDPAPAVSDARPDVPPAMSEAAARAMRKDPADRYPSAGDLGRAALAAAGAAHIRPERSVAVGDAAPAEGVATRPAAAPPPSAPTVPRPAPAPASPPVPVDPTARQPYPSPAPAPVTPAPASGSGSGSGNRGLLIAIAILLVLIAAGGGAYAAGLFDSSSGGGGGTADEPTPQPTPTSTTEPTSTPTEEPTETATSSGGGPCVNQFISPVERDQLSDAQGVNEPAEQGSVFYGTCEGAVWALATFPDGTDGVFRRVGDSWVRVGSINSSRCVVPNRLLVLWKKPSC
jgi:serine/threonine protein kinase